MSDEPKANSFARTLKANYPFVAYTILSTTIYNIKQFYPAIIK